LSLQRVAHRIGSERRTARDSASGLLNPENLALNGHNARYPPRFDRTPQIKIEFISIARRRAVEMKLPINHDVSAFIQNKL
jgi:hypothetical protein